MQMVNSIYISAPLDRIFQLAAEIERWPEVFPYYRRVRTIWQDGQTRVVEVAVSGGWLPVRWASVQHLSRRERRIYYKHVDGLTRGMMAEWSFLPFDDGVQVTIVHDLTLSRPLANSRLGRWIVAEFLVKNVAARTLKHIKGLAERQAALAS